VLPPCAPVPALAALAVHDAARCLPLAVEAMTAAAAATRAGVVRTAGAAEAPVAGCRSGDAVGLVGSEVVAVGADASVVAQAVADRLLGAGGELLTVLHGAVPAAYPAASALCRAVRAARPDVEVHVLDGGQQGAVLLLGVE
jgi:dihydroxyacetone kinase-like predicted kinase